MESAVFLRGFFLSWPCGPSPGDRLQKSVHKEGVSKSTERGWQSTLLAGRQTLTLRSPPSVAEEAWSGSRKALPATLELAAH